MLTLGDMTLLILTFFVLMHSFSRPDGQQFRVALASVQGALATGSITGPAPPAATAPPPTALAVAATGGWDLSQLRAVQERLTGTMAREGLLGGVDVDLQADRVVVRFPDSTLFDAGWADLKPEAVVRLDAVALVLRDLPNRIRVEGHTDSVPISTPQFPSNWELSGARAASVLRYLQDFHRLAPERMEMAGMGQYRPVTAGSDPAARARNRRVEILVMAQAQVPKDG